MNFSRIFIERPIMTTLVMMGLLIFGVVGYFNLPVSDLPNVDFPTIQVSAGLPGANPDTMAASVATPLEQQFTTIAGLDNMNSTSTLGNTQITLQFNLSRNLDAAAQDVQSAISTALPKLPVGMPTPPTLRKVNPADSPILYLSLNSNVLPMYQVDEYAETMIAQRISMVAGVAQVNVYGAQKYAVRVQLDPQELADRNIAISDAAQAIRTGNVNRPVGALYGNNKTLTLNVNGQLSNAAAYRPLVIAYRNGAPVHISDVGQVLDNVENDKTATWLNKRRSVTLAIQRQPGTNTIQVIQDVKKLLPFFESILPPAVHLDVMFDRSISIRRAADDVQFTLLLTIVLVILVIFIFLRSFFATLIASLALPMSIIGTFAAMALLNFSLDNLSLMALTLSVGFVVDDAIVMLENIIRHLEMGKTPLSAALDGSREIGFTIVSMTISLVAVFIPILFMGGLIGRLFNEFAVTIAVAILVSGFVSLTLTPMLCRRLLKRQDLGKTNVFFAMSEKGFNYLSDVYHWTLKKALKYHPLVFLTFIMLLVLTVMMFSAVSQGFIPSDDMDQISGSTEALQGTSFKDMVRHQQKVAAIAYQDPNVKSVMSTVGGSTDNTGRLFLVLKPANKRKMNADQVIQELRPKLSRIPGIRVYLQNPPTIRLGGQTTKGLYQYTLQSPNLVDLYKGTDALMTRFRTIPGLQDVNSDLLIKNPMLDIDIDRNKAAALGISANQIETSLSDAFGTQQISTIYAPVNTYQVIVELKPEFQQSPEALSMVYIRPDAKPLQNSSKGTGTSATASAPALTAANTPLNVPANNPTGSQVSNPVVNSQANLVPLQAIAKLTRTVGPLTISHLGEFPSATISFNLKPGISLGDKVGEINAISKSVLPSTVHGSFQGNAKMYQSSFQDMGVLLILAVFVIYLVLGILYESFIHPITILSGLPAAGLGALFTLFLFHRDLDIYGFLGLIMLIGIVKKNAIMMIDFAIEAERRENLTAQEAIYQACLVRFRPIMMTTLAALMGSLPMALGLGTGAASRQTLGLAVFGGLIVSQLLTLYITPVLYIYLDSIMMRFSKKHPYRGDFEAQTI